MRVCRRGLSHLRVRETSWVRELLQNGTPITLHLLTARVFVIRGHSGCHYSSFPIFVTAWSTILLVKLTVPQTVKKLPTFYGTRRSIYPARFQASAVKKMTAALFWVVTQRLVDSSYRDKLSVPSSKGQE